MKITLHVLRTRVATEDYCELGQRKVKIAQPDQLSSGDYVIVLAEQSK